MIADVKWQAHDANDFDVGMEAACDMLLCNIETDSALRREMLNDPRPLHARLYQPFAPHSNPEYAGTYRGTPGTSLEFKVAGAISAQDGKVYHFADADEVEGKMANLRVVIAECLRDSQDDGDGLVSLAYVFSEFGKIHPFLDGNGHIQRALIAAMAIEFGFTLSARFAIHPRPFGRLMALALESYSRAPNGTEHEELDLVSEYLGLLLDAPFLGPRKHIVGGPLYG